MNEDILIIEDDPAMAMLARDGLAHAGYKVTVLESAERALEHIRTARPALILLDIQLQGISGFQFCEILKQDAAYAAIPIIMLTSLSAEKNKVSGLKMGADDYVTKPFSVKELAARVEALLRRTQRKGAPENVLNAEGLKVNLDTHEVWSAGELVNLTRIEFNLLSVLMREKRTVHRYTSLAQSVWGDDRTATSHTITVAVSRLREKLGKAGQLIESVPGVGYRLKA